MNTRYRRSFLDIGLVENGLVEARRPSTPDQEKGTCVKQPIAHIESLGPFARVLRP